MAISQKATLELTANVQGVKAVRDLQGSVTGLTDATKANTEAQEKAGKSLRGWATDVRSTISLVTGLAKSIAEGARELEQFSQVASSFDGDISLARESTRGMASDFDLMRSKLKLTSLGVKTTDESFAALSGAALRLGQVMGLSVTKSMEDVTTALARGSTRVLDNLGVTLKLAEAQTLYARKLGKLASQLTENEKLMAFQVIGQEKLIKKSKDLGPAIETLTSKFIGMAVSIKNTVFELGNLFNTLGKVKMLGPTDLLTENAKKRLLALRGGTRMPASTKQIEADEKRGEWHLKQEARRKSEAAAFEIFVLEQQHAERLRQQGRKGRGGRRKKTQKGISQSDLARALAGGEQIFPDDAGPSRKDEERMRGDEEKARRASAQEDETERLFEQANAFKELEATKKANYEATLALEKQEAKLSETLTSMASNAIAGTVGGFLDLAAAAAAGEEVTAKAVLGMLAATAMGIAKEAAIKSIFQIAEGLASQAATFGVPNPKSIAHFSAAATYAVVAGVAGAAGIGLSGAAGASGDGGKSRGAESSRSSARDRQAPSRGSAGAKKGPTVVNVYLGGSDTDPSAVLFANKMAEAN